MDVPQGLRARPAVVTEGFSGPTLGPGERQVVPSAALLGWREVAPGAGGEETSGFIRPGSFCGQGRCLRPTASLCPDPSLSLQLGDQGRAACALRHGGARLGHRPAVYPGPRRQLRLELEGQAWPAGEQALAQPPPPAPLSQSSLPSRCSMLPLSQLRLLPGISAVGPGKGGASKMPPRVSHLRPA